MIYVRSHGKCSLTARLYWHNLKKRSNIVDRINNMTLVIRARFDDLNCAGHWLWFDLHIREKLTEMNAIEYVDEFFIEKAMFA
jgi:hypothetical protein